jgi:hypothetical protein
MMISWQHWVTPHPGFSSEAPGPNGMNATAALPFRRLEATDSRRRSSYSPAFLSRQILKPANQIRKEER